MTSALGVDTLLNIFDGDGTAVCELLASALESIDADAIRIERAIAANDFTALREAAHRLRGTGGGIASTRIAEIGSELQRAADASNANVAPALRDELRRAVDLLHVDIEAAKRQINALPR